MVGQTGGYPRSGGRCLAANVTASIALPPGPDPGYLRALRRTGGRLPGERLAEPETSTSHPIHSGARPMQVHLLHHDPILVGSPLMVLPVFSDRDELSEIARRADAALGGAFSSARLAGDFRGKEDEGLLFYLPGHTASGEGGPGDSVRRVLFLGAGDQAGADAERLRGVAARAVRRAEALSLTDLVFELPDGLSLAPDGAAQAVAEGSILAAWDFREFLSTSPAPGSSISASSGPEGHENGGGESDPVSGESRRPLVESFGVWARGEASDAVESGLRTGTAFAEGENLARVLQSRPGNVATPSHLAGIALELAEEYGFEALIMGPEELRQERMGALLSVAAGSDEEPRLIVLEHRGGAAGTPPLALVGKGLTFDTGGISIKPAAGMEDMKYDMSGGAAVLGAMKAVGMLSLPINVVAVVPSCENHISGSATRPGDVIRTRSGRTVEVINTDAEGRLILADALSWVIDRHNPAAVVDCATLTGACVVALGNQAAALLGNDDTLIEELRAAGDQSGERCWPLPLWKAYRKQLESQVADLKNVGGRGAGTITAAWFLSEFVGKARWAHLDIAGTAYGDPRAPYQRKGGFGFPTRLLLEWLRARSA